MSYQSEAQLEQQLIDDLCGRDYERVTIKDMDALLQNFREQLNAFNKDKLCGKKLTDKEFERVLLEVDGKSVYQSAKILRDKLLLNREDGSQIYLELFDGKDYKRNIFQVTNQVTVKQKYTNRYDVTILMNGLPVLQIELKRRGMDIKQAFNQIERYRKHSYHGLFRFVQFFVISNGVDTKYFANNDSKALYSLTFFWTDAQNKRMTNLQDFSRAFFDVSHLTKMIARYTIINDAEKSLMVMRPYQVYATEALVKQAIETANGGYIWHTTGSGKTLTSFKCSQILAQEPIVKKVFFVVDRSDLDRQTTQEFNKFEADSVDATDNTAVLAKQVADEDKTFIVTTIQKLSKAANSKRYASNFAKYQDSKVIIIFDECHRSTFGTQLKAIKQVLPKAQVFGFTGTPRFEANKAQDGRTTADIFGKCLHNYLIKEAILDNNVLGFSVEYIKTFEGQYDPEDKTKAVAIDKEEVFTNPARVALIAHHILEYHNTKTRNRQYTALFAVSSVPMLIAYYKMFREIKHDLKISAVYTYGANEDAEFRDEHSRDALEDIIKDYNKMFGTSYSTDTFGAYASDLMKKIKTAQVDIVIVVGMMLTGFDSKPLNTLYVDKNLEYHNLLQAYSRTNRVEQSTKPFGNIVCYRNLKNNTDDAIRLFSQTGQVDDVLIKDMRYYLDLFRKKLAALLKLAPTPELVDALESEDGKKQFIIAFRELSKVKLVLETFTEFDFDTHILEMTEQEFEEYKSKYFLIYDGLKNDKNYDKVSILNDIDFCIELMATDRINVAYIMNLIRNVDREDKKKQEQEIAHIKNEMHRSDSLELRRKVELIEKFLDEVVPKLAPQDSVDDAYDSFVSVERIAEINAFAQENDVDGEFLRNEIADYEFTGIINKTKIMSFIKKPFVLKNKIAKAITEFIQANVLKYQ